MGKTTLHLVRHAQGYHNLSTANHTLPDPSLTPIGIHQCSLLSLNFPSPAKITHLIASPLRRTLHTCLLSFPSPVNRGLKIIALPELQETSDLPCDTGSARQDLEREFNIGKMEGTVDFGLVGEGWNSKSGRWSPASSAIEARAREARIWLRELAEQAHKDGEEEVEIVVVTHGGFLHYFTEDWEGAERGTGTGWENTEYRSYCFVEGSEEASLLETMGSRKGRGTRGLTGDEQREIRASREAEWRESGLLGGEVEAKL